MLIVSPLITYAYLLRCIHLFFSSFFSGSVLVAAAHRGAYVWGWDIDYLTLHARTKPTRHSQVYHGIVIVKLLILFFSLGIWKK